MCKCCLRSVALQSPEAAGARSCAVSDSTYAGVAHAKQRGWVQLCTMSRTLSHGVSVHDARLLLGAWNVQLLKVIKFTTLLVPKMGLATSVLSKALVDLIFFGVVFGITMFAFSCMFYVQLGPVMEEYNDQVRKARVPTTHVGQY